MKTKLSLQLIIISLIVSLLPSSTFAQSMIGDLLLYDDTSRTPSGITAYNPETGERIQLPVTSSAGSIRTSGDGRIAYIQDNDVWVLDVLNTPNNPINITQTPDEQEIAIKWTPDGSLLQYKVGSTPDPYILYNYDGNKSLAVNLGYYIDQYWSQDGWYITSDRDNTGDFSWYIWNGQERINIEFPSLLSEPVWQTFNWTSNNHLFITIGYNEQGYMMPIGSTQIFYWNGDTVQEIIRPRADETFMLSEWSNDGRLTFYTSAENSINLWYIWDGVSFTSEGTPDMSVITPINTSEEVMSSIEWIPDGRLAVVTAGNLESGSLLGHPFVCNTSCRTEVYLWDEQGLTQLTDPDWSGGSGGFLIDSHDNGYIVVSPFDGLRINGVIIFDNNLEIIFSSIGPYSLSRWSADGNLAFCRLDDLLVWDGENTTELSRRTYSKWLMSDSYSMVCSTG
ncbi:MAG: hypothetical protein Phog2KO_12850 [Phototrophicaceae bacterium]